MENLIFCAVCNFDYFSVIRSRGMKEWYPVIVVCIPTKFGCVSILESCAMNFLNAK